MSDVKKLREALIQREKDWATSANGSLRHKMDGGYSITNTSRAAMAVKSLPLELSDKQQSLEASTVANTSQGKESAMDRRMKAYNEAADAAEKKKPLPTSWTDRYGKP